MSKNINENAPAVQAGHTPGPWGWVYDGSSSYSIGPAADPQNGSVATVFERKHERAEGNLNLIAAAPDLLAALKSAIGWIDPDEHGLVNREEARDLLSACEAAIAKAEGQKPE